MNKKLLIGLMVGSFVCVSFASMSFAQTVPNPQVTNTVSTEKAEPEKKSSNIKPKKHHKQITHHKHTKKHAAKKLKKSEEEKTTSTSQNTESN